MATPTRTSDDDRLASLGYTLVGGALVTTLVGAIYFVVGRPHRGVRGHVHDELEATRAERVPHG